MIYVCFCVRKGQTEGETRKPYMGQLSKTAIVFLIEGGVFLMVVSKKVGINILFEKQKAIGKLE